MQFMNSNLDKLFKNLSDNDFKCLAEEYDPENVEFLNQNGAYPYEYMNSFERFSEKNCLIENVFTAQQITETLVKFCKTWQKIRWSYKP